MMGFNNDQHAPIQFRLTSCLSGLVSTAEGAQNVSRIISGNYLSRFKAQPSRAFTATAAGSAATHY